MGKGEGHYSEDRNRIIDASVFEGFTDERRNWVKMVMERSGLPLNNVRAVISKPASFFDNLRKTLKKPVTVAHFDVVHGTLIINTISEKYPVADQMSDIIHELGHANDPFIIKRGKLVRENARAYGGEENRVKAANHAKAIAEQSLKTGNIFR